MRIPTPFVDGLASLARLEDDQYDALLTSLVGATPTLSAVDLAAGIAPDLSFIGTERLESLLRGVASLTGLRRASRWSVEETARQVAGSEDLDLSEDAQHHFAARISRILDARSVHLMGKAIDVGTEHDHVFLACRILTDIRPIFGDDANERPEGGVLSHTLKFEFVHNEGMAGNFYIALDEDDLAVLKAVVERADAKEQTLKRMLSDFGVSYLGPERP